MGSGIFFFSYIRSIIPHVYVFSAAAAAVYIFINFAEFFFFYFLLVCVFSSRSSLLCSRRALFFFASLTWFTCFGGQVLPSDLLSMYGIVNDNNFSHFIFNDRWAIYLRVHINKRKIGWISFILVWRSCVERFEGANYKKKLEIDLFDFFCFFFLVEKFGKLQSEIKIFTRCW